MLQASTVERWPKLGCDCCMDVPSMVPQKECLLMNQTEVWSNKGCIVWKNFSWASCFGEACQQVGELPSAKPALSGSFIGHENQPCPFFSHRALPLYAAAHISALILRALEQWLRLAQEDLWVPPVSLWCGNTEAHNGCDSKTNASSLLLITLAESPRCSETTDGAVLGKDFCYRKKKKAPTT